MYFIAFVWHMDPSCFYTLNLHNMLTPYAVKWDTLSSKFQCCLESLREDVCMWETLRRNLNSVLVKKACWLPSSHTHRWTVCQGNLTHADQRPPSHPAVGGNGTEREEEEREKELITTNAALHHRFLSPPAHPHCQCLTVYTAPPALSFSYGNVED